MDVEVLEEGWARLIRYVDGRTPEEAEAKRRELFDSFDVNSNGGMDHAELGSGLLSIGILFNTRQLSKFVKGCDKDADGVVSFEDFSKEVEAQKAAKWEREEEKARIRTEKIMKRQKALALTSDFSTEYAAEFAGPQGSSSRFADRSSAQNGGSSAIPRSSKPEGNSVSFEDGGGEDFDAKSLTAAQVERAMDVLDDERSLSEVLFKFL